MTFFTRRTFGVAGLLIAAALLTACGDPEPEQRKAFMAFLQGMIDRQGVHVMNAKADDDKTFGAYTKHYAVILDFNRHMATMSSEFADKMKQVGNSDMQQRTIEQMVAHRDDIVTAGEIVTKMHAAVTQELASAQAARAALSQPDDLKKVYDAAFDKLVVQPSLAVQRTEEVLADGVKQSLQLVDYVAAHQGKLTVSGSRVQARDAKTLSEVNELMKAHNAQSIRFDEARRNMSKVVEGN